MEIVLERIPALEGREEVYSVRKEDGDQVVSPLDGRWYRYRGEGTSNPWRWFDDADYETELGIARQALRNKEVKDNETDHLS